MKLPTRHAYGIRRLILINSGTYAFAVFPIDEPLSICGENNAGKSTAVNALQFIFLADMRDMDFGKHDHLTTRRFYFPGPGSYVLAEIRLESGVFVVGAAGSGPASSHQMHHFVYRGEFDPDDFSHNGTALPLAELLRGLQRRGRECCRLHPQELRKMLLGMPTDRPIELTMIPLRGHRERYVHAWLTIFKNLIHMRNVNSQDLKDLLLDVFDISLVGSDVDFAREYQRVNAEVSRISDELDLVHKIRPHVEPVLDRHETRQDLRGRIHAAYREVRHRLTVWYADYEDFRLGAEKRLAGIEPAREELARERAAMMERFQQLSGDLRSCTDKLRALRAQQAEFELVESMQALDDGIARLTAELEQLIESLGTGKRISAEILREEIAQTQGDLAKVERMLDFLDCNLWGLLSDHFTTDQLRDVFALLNHDLLQLPVGEEHGQLMISEEAPVLDTVRRLLERIDNRVFRGDGFAIDLSHLSSFDPKQFLDRTHVEQRRDAAKAKLERLNLDLEAVIRAEELAEKKLRLQKTLRERMDFRNRYAAFAREFAHYEDLTERERVLTNDNQVVRVQLDTLASRERALEQEYRELTRELRDRHRQAERLEEAQTRVVPLPPEEPAGYPFAGNHPEDIEELIEAYILDLEDKQREDERIATHLNTIEELGGAVFMRDAEAALMENLRETVASIPQREELLLKARGSAVVELGSTLKGLRDNYRRLEAEIAGFNREINRKAVSNLTRIELRLQRNERVMEAIEELVDSNELGLFEDRRKATRAAEFLYSWVGSQGRKLNLTHLFELCFAVFGASGRELVYENLDRIESHGTTITIKALVNMHLLRHLLEDARVGRVRIPYYLDEAASIDMHNQETLIEQGLAMGFVPVLASVKPQPAATYCVRISKDRSRGNLVIDERSWVRVERDAEEETDTPDEGTDDPTAAATA